MAVTPTPDPARATRPRDGPPEQVRGQAPRRVIAMPPDGLGEFAAIIGSSTAPAVVMIDREFMRTVLSYIADLEREAADTGSFW